MPPDATARLGAGQPASHEPPLRTDEENEMVRGVGRMGMLAVAMAATLGAIGGQPVIVPERERYSAPRPPIRKPKKRKPYEAKVHTQCGSDTRDDKYLHSAARRRRLAALMKGD